MYKFIFSLFFLLMISAQADIVTNEWLGKIISDNSDERELAITHFREMGQEGLDILMKRYISERRGELRSDVPKDAEVKIRCAIDAVACQKYAAFSGLYWYTDLQKAQQVAAQENKPILSLHMLGKLYDDLSCANSRFMRAVLYTNNQISQYLKENFVLHWHSVRPVPVITIDFGDGRVIKRTITGNSIHYLLDNKARLIDAIPGLYDPDTFYQVISSGHSVWRQLENTSEKMRSVLLVAYHQQKLSEIQATWFADLKKLNLLSSTNQVIERQNISNPSAIDASKVAVTKSGIELPILNMMDKKLYANNQQTIKNTSMPKAFTIDDLRQKTNDDAWLAVAQLHEAKIDIASKYMIAYQNPSLLTRKTKKLFVEMISNFEKSLALDAIRNQYDLHSQIHQWFIDGAWRQNHKTFNDKVYSEMFLTPSSDPWLGLKSDNLYTGLMEE